LPACSLTHARTHSRPHALLLLSQGFKTHIHSEHDKFNYLFFLVYLQNKDETEFTGVETYVANKVKDEDVAWIPERRALALEQTEEETPEDLLAASSGEVRCRVLTC
jgi:hypothetical protein